MESVAHTVHAFRLINNSMTIKSITAKEIIQGNWMKDATLLIIPGGADRYYAKNLNGYGNARIKEYVASGGRFLGICAGGYYGSAFVEFDKNGPLEVIGTRELNFFPGKAVGPACAPYDYLSKIGASAQEISTTLIDSKKTVIFYNGGAFFENADRIANTKVIGWYQNHRPAIVLVNHFKGKVLLSGVHVEYQADLLYSQDPYLKNIIPIIKKNEATRHAFLIALMQELGVIE